MLWENGDVKWRGLSSVDSRRKYQQYTGLSPEESIVPFNNVLCRSRIFDSRSSPYWVLEFMGCPDNLTGFVKLQTTLYGEIQSSI